MTRMTHERVNGIRTGYWSASKKEDLVQRLALYENLGIDPENVHQPSPGGTAMRERLRQCWTDADYEAQENLWAMTPLELFEVWLNWEGIICYGADTIIDRLRECGFLVEEGGSR